MMAQLIVVFWRAVICVLEPSCPGNEQSKVAWRKTVSFTTQQTRTKAKQAQMPQSATFRIILVMIASGALIASSQSLSNESLPNLFPFPNAKGLLETYNIADQPIDLTGPFFQSLGT